MIELVTLLAIFSPLLGSLSLVFAKMRKRSQFSYIHLVPIFYLGTAVLCSSFLLYGILENKISQEFDIKLLNWISFPALEVNWGIRIDILSCVMLWILDLVSLLVHFYIIGRMENPSSRNNLFIALGFFTFSTSIFLVANNFLQLFLGWELVGIFSYLLIGVYSENSATNAAAFKGFIMNSLGDMALLIAIIIIYNSVHSFSFDFLEKEALQKISPDTIGVLGGLLFFAAITKSAQIGFHSWLSSAMEASNSVSALVHSSIIVTTGVFLLLRLSNLLEICPTLKLFVIITGSATTILCAASALTHHSLKKILGYSISSQVGFMMVDVGFSYYRFVLFHLIAHSLLYPLIFLTTGFLIESSEEDKKRDSLNKAYLKRPFLYPLLFLGIVGLCILPFYSGHYLAIPFSKILSGHFTMKTAIFFSLSCVGSFLTALYTGRMIVLTFRGNIVKSENEKGLTKNISSWISAVLVALIISSLLIGIMTKQHINLSLHSLLIAGGIIFLGFSIIGGLYFLSQDIRRLLVRKFNPLHKIIREGWYFDELYEVLLVRPFNSMAVFLAQKVEYGMIDKVSTEGSSFLLKQIYRGINFFQSGQIFYHLVLAAAGFIFLMALLIFR
jgi:NADH-quinone oxidoreductase subunit L